MLERDSYPTISVIIPSYNQGQYLEETLLSVFGQAYPRLEVLVIDGGSTDHTVDILEHYCDQIAYWHSHGDRGQSDAINQGMQRSSGEVVCWLNSDDMYMPGTLLDIGARFKHRTEELLIIHGAGMTMSQDNGKLAVGKQAAVAVAQSALAYQNFILQPSTFWTRQLWRSVGELDLSLDYIMDWDWFVRAAQVGKFEYVPRFYSIYRYHQEHKTSSGGSDRRKEIATLVKKYASPYWAELYTAVNENYAEVKSRLALLNSFRFLPKQHLLWQLLSPNLIPKLNNFWDLITVMNAYASAADD
jgi:glycosyltransferase involved in cell wall biosynthesis